MILRDSNGAAQRGINQKMWLFALLTLAALLLAGCRERKAAPEAAAQDAPAPQGALPSRNTSAVVRPEEGGVIALQEGAQVSFPAGSVSDTAIASLRVIDAVPAAPIPRSIIGDAYELKVEDGQLTGNALIKLPLPDGVSPDEYELAAYRWNGRNWERVGGRVAADGIQFGSNVPALYALQGRWRPGSARLTATSAVTDTLQATVPISVTGQYRYTAPPVVKDGFVQAQLTLKRDISGGAGQVSGNADLDETIAEAPLLFQPAPGSAQGVVDFAHQITISPGALDVPPGETARLYAVLTVSDSQAPTRQTSSAVEYVQFFPIKIVGADVIRPAMANEGRLPLRWNVQLNGQTLAQPAASDIALPLQEVLAQGGLGEYRITLEAQVDDRWEAASNAVTVTLALPGTPTPQGGSEMAGGGTPIASLGDAPTPTEPPPPTPTRRAAPVFPTAPPTIELTPTLPAPLFTPTPERPEWASFFWADQYNVAPGGCTLLHWNVQNVEEVYLNGAGVVGVQTQQVCPQTTTTYTLRTVAQGKTQDWYVTIRVTGDSQVAFEFTADQYEIAQGACTTLRWKATNVRAVYLNDEGVPGEASRQVCPGETTSYVLRVDDSSGSVSTRTITVSVVPSNRILIRFWADQYTLNPGACTTLYWAVENVQAVYMETEEGERGVPGVSQERVCPEYSTDFTIVATAPDGRSDQKTVSLDVGAPTLSGGEVIAQAVVRSVDRVDDADDTAAGNQPGWKLLVDGVNPLFRGPGDCCQAALTLQLPQVFTSGRYAVDWPISPGQQIEFRSVCLNSSCLFRQGNPFYLLLRSR